MIEVKTPRDIMVYQTKVLGPLTLKQLVCVVIAVILDIVIYGSVIQPFQLGEKTAFYIIALIDVPVLAFGYYKPKGIALEKYLKMIFQTSFLAPSLRKNRKTFCEKPETTKKKIRRSKIYKAYK